MNTSAQKIRLLTRAEMALLRIHMRVAAKQSALYATAILLVLLSVLMLNVAAYFALNESFGKDVAALIVAAVNAVLAIILMLIASRTKPGPEAEMAQEIRDLAVAEINADVDRIRDGVNEVRADVQRIRSGFSGLVGGGSGFSLLQLGPLLDLLIGILRKAKNK